jgi:hypothetical protein
VSVLPAIERLTHAGKTPALHSEVQKQAAFGINPSIPFFPDAKGGIGSGLLNQG